MGNLFSIFKSKSKKTKTNENRHRNSTAGTPAARHSHHNGARRSSQAFSAERNLVYHEPSNSRKSTPESSQLIESIRISQEVHPNLKTPRNTPVIEVQSSTLPLLVNYETNTSDENEYAKLEGVQCHAGRVRRRESVVPSVFSIVEDPYLEILCEDSGQEPEGSADRMSRNDRKRLVNSVTEKLRRSTVRSSQGQEKPENQQVQQTARKTLENYRKSKKIVLEKRAGSEPKNPYLEGLIKKPEALQDYLESSLRKSMLGTSNPMNMTTNSAMSSLNSNHSEGSLLQTDQSVVYQENSRYREQELLEKMQGISEENLICKAEDLENARLERFRRSTE